jgi:hypothetical protein
MTKTILLGAAAALLMSTSALAQSTGATTPGPTSPAPTNNNPATGVETPPAAGTTGSSMGSTTDDTAGATTNRSGDPTTMPAPAGSASQYGSDTATGQPYNPVPQSPPSQTEMNQAGDRG